MTMLILYNIVVRLLCYFLVLYLAYMVRLSKLNRRNWWPIAMFQTLLVAHALSGLREEQLVMSHFFQFSGGFGTWNVIEKTGYRFFEIFFLFWAYASTLISPPK